MTSEEHNKYIAWAFLVNGSLQALVLLFVIGVLVTIFATVPPGDEFPGFVFAIIGFALFVNLLFVSPSFIAAYALLKRKPWARITAIVAAALSATNAPLGTLAAVYSLWFFCGEQWRTVYPATADNGDYDRIQIQPPASDIYEARYRNEADPARVHRTPPPPDWR